MNRSRRRLWTAGVIVTLIVSLLYVTGGVVSGLRGAANLVVTPFSWTINVIARPIGHLLAGAVNYSDVVAQNQRLRYELGQAELKNKENWRSEEHTSEL